MFSPDKSETTDPDAYELLLLSADLIEEAHWIRGALAKDSKGRIVEPDSASAVGYCIDGALCYYEHVLRKDHTVRTRAAGYLRDHLGAPSLWSWNDEVATSKEEVVKALRDTANTLIPLMNGKS